MTLMVGSVLTLPSAGLVASTLIEDDAAVWAAPTTYVIGDRAMIVGTTHNVYECILGHGTPGKDPLIAANIGVYWILVGKTNVWRVFDGAIGTGTVTSDASVLWRIAPGAAVLNMAVMNIRAAEFVAYHLNGAVSTVNFADRSEGFNDAVGWTAVLTSITANQSRDPVMLNSAEAILETVTASEKGVDSVTTRSYTIGSTYTVSCYFKRYETGTGRNVRLIMPTGAFGVTTANFTLSGAGTAAAATGAPTVAITALPDGWYRCSMTKVATATTTTTVGSFRILDAALATSHTGAVNSGFYAWGFQNNNGALAAYQLVLGGIRYNRTLMDSQDWTFTGDELFTADRFMQPPSYGAGDLFEIFATLRSSALDLSVGEIVMAYNALELGTLIEPLERSLLDFSVINRNDFGTLELLKRDFAADINYTFTILKIDRQRIARLLENRRASPLLFWDTLDVENLFGLLGLAIIRGFSMPMIGADTNIVSLDTEGLS